MIWGPDNACQSGIHKVVDISGDKQNAGIHAHIDVDIKATFKSSKSYEKIVELNTE